MAIKTTGSRNPNDFYPEDDVIRRTDDGREIVVARKGAPMTMAKARQYGLIGAETTATAADTETGDAADESKGSKGAAENKSRTPKSNKGGDK